MQHNLRLASVAAAIVCLTLSAASGFCRNPESPVVASSRVPVCDKDAAFSLCDSLPLSSVEGVWIYPDDHVTVLVLRNETNDPSELPSYALTVVETTDCKLNPGEIIGTLSPSPDPKKFTLSLFTSRKKGKLSDPKSCLATLSNDGESMVVEKEKSKIRLRVNFNPSSILPALWKSLVRFGISIGDGSRKKEAPVGMVKIYPSFDGDGSSSRGVRYL